MKTLYSICKGLGWSCTVLSTQTVFAPLLEYLAQGAPRCRCLSTESCWPSSSDFEALARQVSQPLLSPVPPASACYTSSEASEECLTAAQSWIDGLWRSIQPGAMQHPNFQAAILPNGTVEACYLNTTLGAPCDQGSIPVIGVDARSPEDIQAAVRFAAAHNLRFVIKNTGHDYLGRSTARGAFLIWTHHMKNIAYHEDFTPNGAPSSEPPLHGVITLGAGVQWQEAYDAAFAHNRDIVGGLSMGATVGAAGGWLQGGGHSALSPSYGLGVDNVVEISIVTADGEHIIANPYQHQDLFWALRGGGGGTWGVITSVTYQTHPSTPLIVAYFLSSIDVKMDNATTTPSPVLKKLFTEFVRMTPAMTDGGWSGYADIVPSETPQAALTLRVAYIAQNVSWEKADETMLPFFNFAQDLASKSSADNGGHLNITLMATAPVDAFRDWQYLIFRNKTGQVGINVELGSWLLTRDVLVEDYEKVANTILDIGVVSFYVVTGGVVTKVDPSSTGLNPAWRKALVHTVFGRIWPDGSSASTINKVREDVKRIEGTLRDLAPESGAYFNEASLYQADFKHAFFGAHYDKLRKIKKIYDPTDLFLVPAGVGSDEWDADLHCRL